MTTQFWFWIGFIIFILAMLTLDLGVFQRRAHEIKPKEALLWTGFWVSLVVMKLQAIVLAVLGYEGNSAWSGAIAEISDRYIEASFRARANRESVSKPWCTCDRLFKCSETMEFISSFA